MSFSAFIEKWLSVISDCSLTFGSHFLQVVVSKDGEPTELLVEYDKEKSMKPKGVLHWVSASPHSQTVEVRPLQNANCLRENTDKFWFLPLAVSKSHRCWPWLMSSSRHAPSLSLMCSN